MNEHFVSIKVDREERPDLDGIYMDAVQAMTGQGGWPLSVFLTPGGEPFYRRHVLPAGAPPRHAGIPRRARRHRGGLAAASRRGRDQGERDRRRDRSGGPSLRSNDAALDEALVLAATTSLLRTFDGRWGGFGGAPKFPQPMTLEFLLRRAVRGGPEAVEVLDDGDARPSIAWPPAASTTTSEAASPATRPTSAGTCRTSRRCSTTTRSCCSCTRAPGRSPAPTATAPWSRETAEYLLREMQHPEGGFFSSQDADSDGVEGKFFTWSWAELTELIGEPVARAFGATPDGNWAGEDGRTNVLWRPRSISEVAIEHGLDAAELQAEVEDARPALFAARETRSHPATDDKVLAAWNGMTIAALAEAGRVFDEPDYVTAAERAATFVLTHLRGPSGRLLRSWRNGVAGRPGFADDHALMASACLTLFETTFEPAWFDRATELTGELRRLFPDREAGGFFMTGADADALLVRPKELYDNATPSGNSVAADLLLRLSAFTGDATFEAEAVSALRLVGDALPRAPGAFGQALCALDRLLGPTRAVAIVGEPERDDTRALVIEANRRRYRPNIVLAVSADDDADARRAVPLLRDRAAIGGRATAYVCEGFSCRVPVAEPDALTEQLAEAVGG